MLSELRPEGVLIATPTFLHAEDAQLCLEQGLPVFVEKPITATVEEAEALLYLAATQDLPILVGHQRRYYPFVQQAHDWIQAGRLGKLVGISGQWTLRKDDEYYAPDWRKQVAAGPVLTNLIHELDLLRFLCGEILSVSAEVSDHVQGFAKEDVAALILRFANHAVGTFLLSDQTPSPWHWEGATGENLAFPHLGQNSLRLLGTEAALDFPNLTLWRYDSSPGDWRRGMSAEQQPLQMMDAYVAQLQHFVRVIRQEVPPLISGSDATQTLRATLAVLESAQRGQRVELSAG